MLKLIKEKINKLRNDLPRPEDLIDRVFKEDILLKYSWRLINSLEGILNNNPEDDVVLKEALKHFLQDNWALVKGSLLAYTALPSHPITQLLCDVANYVAENTQSAAIGFLMPGVVCDSLSPWKYGNLDEMDLIEVLQIHALGKDFTYLVPISILAKEGIDIGLDKIVNPYYDADIHDKHAVYLSIEELKRLAEHSSETTALYSLRENYLALANDTSTLLGKLKEFIKDLGFYSVQGIGEEDAAGENSYAKLVNFIEFWDVLDKKDVPDVVKGEIELIKQLGSDKNKHGDIASCFATRRTELLTAIKGNEPILASIVLSAEKKESSIKKTMDDFDKVSADLQQCLQKKEYTGQDRLGVTTKILDELGVGLSVANFSALIEILRGLRVEEVGALCALPQAPEKIVIAINGIENMVILASVELNEEILSALLQGIKGKIDLIITSPQDFSSFLIPLNVDQCTVVLEALKEELPEII
ncbi:MAG: hypothetical protein V4471_03645, partial [Pseudomonadota bacterium]